MNNTINGKSVEQVVKELSVPFSEEDKEKTRQGFVSVNVQKYRDRLDSVVGVFNYSVEVIDTKYTETAILKTVAITIFYDDGRVAVTKHGDGGDLLVYPEGSTKPKDIGNTNESATSDAFKRACKLLRIGIDIYRENRVITGRESSLIPKHNSLGAPEVEEFKLVFNSPLIQDGSLRNSYHADVRTIEGELVTLVIWDDDARKLKNAGQFEEVLNISKRKGKIKLMGYFQVFGQKQYKQIVFVGGCL